MNFFNVYKRGEYEVIDKMRVTLTTYAACKVTLGYIFFTQIYCTKQNVNNYTPYIYISSSESYWSNEINQIYFKV